MHAEHRRRHASGDLVLALLTRAGAALTLAGLMGVIWPVLHEGLPRLSWAFLQTDPLNAGRAGGIAPMLVSTGALLAVALLATGPLGLAVALWLSEYTGQQGRRAAVAGLSLDALAGVPSIVFGLFGSAFFCDALGLGYSLLAGGLTLACMILPVLIRTAHSSLQALPTDWRLGGAALGMSRWRLAWHVLLPHAMPGVAVGIMLGTGRALAETAALIFTSGYVDRMPDSLMDSGRALSVHIYDLSMNVAGGDATASASAIVLMTWVLLVNALTTALSQWWLRRAATGQP